DRESVELGDHHVDDDEVGVLSTRQRQAGFAVGGRAHQVALHAEVQHEPAEDRRVVLDDDDLLAHARPACADGSAIVNVVPFPTSEATLIFPPWASTMCFTMASPRPLPS